MTSKPSMPKPGHEHPKPENYKLWVTDGKAEEGKPVDFYVKIDGKADHDIKVFYATSDGSAKAGRDYVPEYHYVTIKAGTDSAKIDIKTIEDKKYEPTETFNLKVWEYDKHVHVKDGHAVGTIYDDDHKKYEQPKVSVGDDKEYEGDAKGATMRFKVTVDGDNDHGLLVRYHTEAGKGPYGANNYDKDYIPKGGDLYIKPGENHGYIEVKVIGDTKKEYDEYFKVILDDTHYYKVDDGVGIGTILNDGKPPVTPSFHSEAIA